MASLPKAASSPRDRRLDVLRGLCLFDMVLVHLLEQKAQVPWAVSDASLPPYFQCVIDRVAKVFTYIGCKVARATFRSAKGQPLEVAVEIAAIKESIGAAGSFPALALDAAAPFVFTDGVLTLGGTVYQVEEFETTIDWHLKLDRYMNSQYRTDLVSTDLTVRLRADKPINSGR